MPGGHFTSSGASIDYDDAGCLFPVDELDATVLQYRDAQLTLEEATGSDIIVISPNSLATSYVLTQHPLTTISVESLSTVVWNKLNDKLDVPLDTFEFIQIGKWNGESPNRSLAEFADV